LIEPVNGNYDERRLFLELLAAMTELEISLLVFLIRDQKASTQST
jgi:hypothetical protein